MAVVVVAGCQAAAVVVVMDGETALMWATKMMRTRISTTTPVCRILQCRPHTPPPCPPQVGSRDTRVRAAQAVVAKLLWRVMFALRREGNCSCCCCCRSRRRTATGVRTADDEHVAATDHHNNDLDGAAALVVAVQRCSRTFSLASLLCCFSILAAPAPAITTTTMTTTTSPRGHKDRSTTVQVV